MTEPDPRGNASGVGTLRIPIRGITAAFGEVEFLLFVTVGAEGVFEIETVLPIKVTSVCPSARPFNTAPFCIAIVEAPGPARMIPLKFAPV